LRHAHVGAGDALAAPVRGRDHAALHGAGAGARGGTAMTGPAAGIGLRRLQHLVLWVSDVGRSVRFYRDVLGFEVTVQRPRAAFLKIPGSADDHHLGLFEQPGVGEPDERVARMYHAAWEVGE